MLRALAVILSLAWRVPALRPYRQQMDQGAQGGHIVDAGGGKQHWELVAKGNELVLYVTDADEKPVKADGGSAKGRSSSAARPTRSTSSRLAETR